MAPRNISDLNENYRRYNFQAFANISGNFTTLFVKHCIHRLQVPIIHGRTERPKTKCLLAANRRRRHNRNNGVSWHTSMCLQYIINISSLYSKASCQHAQNSATTVN